MKSTPILFVDLDGTVRKGFKELGYFVHGPEDVELFDGVLDILKSYKEKGWRIVAISNQGGIAMGKVESNVVARAMQETNRLCANLFDRMMWCPHHPEAIIEDEEGNRSPDFDNAICLCRKPKIGNVVLAMAGMAQQFGEYYTPHNCLFVGDLEDDRQCADNASIPFIWADKWRGKGPLVA